VPFFPASQGPKNLEEDLRMEEFQNKPGAYSPFFLAYSKRNLQLNKPATTVHK
jgi:hypothetical protein